MMSPEAAAATCHRAAAGMRGLAASAPAGDWHLEMWDDPHPDGSETVAVCAGTDTAVAQCGDARGQAAGAYIARMGPATGGFVADMLDRAGDQFAARQAGPMLDSALAVAESFLRQQRPTGAPVALVAP